MDWFRRLADVPRVPYDGSSSIDRSSLDGYNLKPTVSEFEHGGKVHRSLVPLKIQDGILVYYRPAVGVYAVRDDGGSVVKEILIGVYERSAGREEVERFYNQLLSRESLSCAEGRGVFAHRFSPAQQAELDDDFEDDYWSLPESAVLQLLVRPEREAALNPLVFELMVRPQLEQLLAEQGKFPKPRAVGAFYECCLGWAIVHGDEEAVVRTRLRSWFGSASVVS